MTSTVLRISLELHHLKETERQERENLMLRLENTLLRFERRLPPVEDDRGRLLE